MQPDQPSSQFQQSPEIQQASVVTQPPPKRNVFATGGAEIFYYIALISLVNSLLFIFGAGFYGSMGITSIITYIAMSFAEGFAGGTGATFIINGIGFLINAVIAGVVALFGFLSNRGYGWVYVVGMIAYTFDALIMLWAGDWIEVAIHLYFLFLLWKGWSSLRKIKHDIEELNPPVIG